MQKVELSRRDFLKLAGLGLGALAFAPFKDKSPAERLQEFGLEDYFNFYQAGQEWNIQFGIKPPLFADVLETVNKVVNGEIINTNDPAVTLLRDGWGNKKFEAVDLARLHIKNMEIDTSATGDDPELYRQFLDSKADDFPQALLASPKKLVIKKNYGFAGGDTWGLPTQDNPFFANFPQIALLHELEHEIQGGRWKDIKSFVDRKSFGKYITTWLNNVLEVNKLFIYYKQWISLGLLSKNWYRWDTDDELFAPPADPKVKKELIKKYYDTVKKWSEDSGVGFYYEEKDLNEDNINNAWLELQESLINKLYSLQQKNDFIERNRAILEASLLTGFHTGKEINGKYYSFHVEGYFFGISHSLIGPVENEWGVIPSVDRKYTGYIDTDAQIELQEAFLEAFSTLGLDVKQEELRGALDLPAINPCYSLALIPAALAAIFLFKRVAAKRML